MPERRDIPIARSSSGEETWQAVREPSVSGWLTQPLHNCMSAADYRYVVDALHEPF